MSQRNKRKWWEDGELAVLDKCDGTRPVVRIKGMMGDGVENGQAYVLYQVVEIKSHLCYPASDRGLHRPTRKQLDEARQNAWQLQVAVEAGSGLA